MGRIIKRHSSFFAWVFLPSLLLLASVLGVNLVSKPSFSLLNSSCGSLTADPNCDIESNPCVDESCNSLTGLCDATNPASPASPPGTVGSACGCNECGNARCEPASGENPTTCPEDCPSPPSVAVTFVAPATVCTAASACDPIADGCCPGVQCTAPTTAAADCPPGSPASCDPDCCFQCGDGVVAPPEQCEPGLLGGCDIQAGETCGAVGTANQCQCVAITCGNGVLEAGEQCDPGILGSCGGDPYDVCLTIADAVLASACGGTFLPCTCFNCTLEGTTFFGCGGDAGNCEGSVSSCPGTTPAGGGAEASVLPTPTALQQAIHFVRPIGWAGALVLPGVAYFLMRKRRSKNK